MLILTRKTGEAILIGEDIRVVVTSVDQNKVKLGIESPAHVPIYREELYLKIQENNRQAASIKPDDVKVVLELYSAKGKDDGPRGG